MGFTVLAKPSRNYGGEPVPAFKSYTLGDHLVGEVFIPAPTVEKLGWKKGMHFDVAVGDGEDAGWFALIPMDRKAKAKLRENPNGTFSFRERTLAHGLKAPLKRVDIQARAEDGQFIFQRPDA